jgi:hypothetical protein
MENPVDENLIQASDVSDREPLQNLADFLMNSPFAGAELDLERRQEFMRVPDL